MVGPRALAAGSPILTVAATGRLTRWLPFRARLAAAAGAIAGFAAMAVDVIIFILLASKLVAAPGTLAHVPVALAATASLIRLILARRAGRRCLAVRAALT